MVCSLVCLLHLFPVTLSLLNAKCPLRPLTALVTFHRTVCMEFIPEKNPSWFIPERNHKIIELSGRHHKDPPISIPLPLARAPSTRPGYTKPHPTWCGTLPGIGHPLLLSSCSCCRRKEAQSVPGLHPPHSEEFLPKWEAKWCQWPYILQHSKVPHGICNTGARTLAESVLIPFFIWIPRETKQPCPLWVCFSPRYWWMHCVQ